jgi:hypothetical protein
MLLPDEGPTADDRSVNGNKASLKQTCVCGAG